MNYFGLTKYIGIPSAVAAFAGTFAVLLNEHEFAGKTELWKAYLEQAGTLYGSLFLPFVFFCA